MVNYYVDINPDEGYIRISNDKEEVLYWEHTEWEDDPELIFTITNAVKIALTDPNKMTSILNKMGMHGTRFQNEV